MLDQHRADFRLEELDIRRGGISRPQHRNGEERAHNPCRGRSSQATVAVAGVGGEHPVWSSPEGRLGWRRRVGSGRAVGLEVGAGRGTPNPIGSVQRNFNRFHGTRQLVSFRVGIAAFRSEHREKKSARQAPLELPRGEVTMRYSQRRTLTPECDCPFHSFIACTVVDLFLGRDGFEQDTPRWFR